MNTETTTAMALTQQLAEATDNIRNGITTYRARIGDLGRQLARAIDTMAPKADVRARFPAVVASAGARGMVEVLTLVQGQYGLAKPARAPDAALARKGESLMTWDVLCALDPGQALARLEALLARAEYDEGPPLAERPALVDRLTRELAAVEAAEEQAIDAAAVAGLVIEHRPEVVERRSQERRTREEQERIAEVTGHRARQAAIDSSYGPPRAPLHDERRPSSGESDYITRNRPPRW